MQDWYILKIAGVDGGPMYCLISALHDNSQRIAKRVKGGTDCLVNQTHISWTTDMDEDWYLYLPDCSNQLVIDKLWL